MQTVLRAKLRSTGKYVEVPSESLNEQTEKLHSFYNKGSSEYSEAGIYYLQPKQVVPVKEVASEKSEPVKKVQAPKSAQKAETPS